MSHPMAVMLPSRFHIGIPSSSYLVPRFFVALLLLVAHQRSLFSCSSSGCFCVTRSRTSSGITKADGVDLVAGHSVAASNDLRNAEAKTTMYWAKPKVRTYNTKIFFRQDPEDEEAKAKWKPKVRIDMRSEWHKKRDAPGARGPIYEGFKAKRKPGDQERSHDDDDNVIQVQRRQQRKRKDDDRDIHEEEATGRMRMAATYMEQGSIEDALNQYRQVRNLLEDLGRFESLQGAGVQFKLGVAMKTKRSKPSSYIIEFKAARRILSDIGKLENTRKGATLLYHLGEAHKSLGEEEEALEALKLSEKAFKASHSLGSLEGARMLIILAELRQRKGGMVNYRHALKASNDACDILQAIADLANARAAEDLEGSNAELTRFSDVTTSKVFGETYASAKLVMGDICLESGDEEADFAEAVEHYDDARMRLENSESLTTDLGARVLLKLAIARVKAEKDFPILAYLENWIAQFKASDDGERVLTETKRGARLQAQVSKAYLDVGDTKAAAENLEEAVKSFERGGHSATPEGVRLLMEVAVLHTKNQDYTSAMHRLNDARRGLESKKRGLASDVGVELLEAIGDMRLRLGEDMKALRAYETARKLATKLSEGTEGLMLQTPEGQALEMKITSLEHRFGYYPGERMKEEQRVSKEGQDQEDEAKLKARAEARKRRFKKGGIIGGIAKRRNMD